MKLALSPPVLQKARPGLAAFCLLVFLALYTMVAFPALHALVHSDACDPSHQCAVTLFSHGQVHCASTAVEFLHPAPIFLSNQPPPAPIFVPADVRLLPGRGPPSALLFV
jgi:hypothetical protein